MIPTEYLLISHRGNLSGPQPEWENHPDYIRQALAQGFQAEIDVRAEGGSWRLGHDSAQFLVDADFLLQPGLWCHAKDLLTLKALMDLGAHCFFHDTDAATLTSQGWIWTFPGKALTARSIAVVPEKAFPSDRAKAWGYAREAAGICSDWVGDFKHAFRQ
ncbi:hypothetical protein K2X33_04280 [bacterium]|nr:hypothetical protein [bacterium]